MVSIFEKGFFFDINTLVSGQVTLVGCNVYFKKNSENTVQAI